MTDQKKLQLLPQYLTWIDSMVAHHRRLADFECPACAKTIRTARPPLGDRPWDTLSTCPYCETLFHKVVHCDGRVQVVLLKRGAAA